MVNKILTKVLFLAKIIFIQVMNTLMNTAKEIEELKSDVARIMKRIEKLTTTNSDEVASTLSEYVDTVTDNVKQYASSAANTAKEQALIAKERATLAAKKTQRYAEENPWAVAGIAAGAAVVIALLASSRRDRD